MFRITTKAAPLPAVRRLPGQSLRDEKERLCDDRLLPYVVAPATFWLIWLVQSIYSWTKAPPQPRFWLAVAIIVTGSSAIGFLRLIDTFRRLNRGERGELRVAEVLADLRSAGYRAIHDLVCHGFNVDHVLVGPGGVFAIETKFRSGRGLIEFRNGEGLFVDGRPEDKDCLKQARANAAEVNRLIKENCAREAWVTPLVVFVGDWKVKDNWRNTDARVFTADQLPRYIRQQQPELTKREIELIASHLERSVKC